MYSILNAEIHSSLINLFNFSTRKIGSINIVLGYLSLGTTRKKLGKKEVLLNFSNKS